METTKQWYQSKTVWGGLIAIAAALLKAAGTEISAVDQTDLVDAAINMAGAVGGIVAIYGRLSAKAGIGGQTLSE